MITSHHHFYRYPLFVMAGLLTYQIYGWITGRRLLDTVNGEAMLFVLSVGYLIGMRWFVGKVDATCSEDEPSNERLYWWLYSVIGAITGVVLRICGV